jgi:hypothetical protein
MSSRVDICSPFLAWPIAATASPFAGCRYRICQEQTDCTILCNSVTSGESGRHEAACYRSRAARALAIEMAAPRSQ